MTALLDQETRAERRVDLVVHSATHWCPECKHAWFVESTETGGPWREQELPCFCKEGTMLVLKEPE